MEKAAAARDEAEQATGRARDACAASIEAARKHREAEAANAEAFSAFEAIAAAAAEV